MKKIISCFLAAALAFHSIAMDISAADKGVISAGSVGVIAGETFSIPVKISDNPGITALSLRMNYDPDMFELISAEDTGLFEGAEFLAGDDTKKNWYTMNWDDISKEDHTENGVLANVTFRAKDTAEGTSDIKLYASAYNVTLSDVTFTTSGGKVNVKRNPDSPTISADDVFGLPGDIVDMPVRLANNPGLMALSLSVSYDHDKLELAGVSDGGILGKSEFLSGNDMKAAPYILNWDDISKKNNTGNGVLAVLSFRILEEIDDPSPVRISLNRGSVFDVDLNDVDFYTLPGSVKTPDLSDIITIKERVPLEYTVEKTASPYNISADKVTLTDEHIYYSSYTNNTSYNNGFGYRSNTDCLHEVYTEDGPMYVFYGYDDTAAIFTESSDSPLIITNEGWEYGAGTVGDDGCFYILWGKAVTPEEVFRDNDIVNLCIIKYDANGVQKGKAELENSKSNSYIPFHAGNAAIGCKDGVVLAFLDTLWNESADGLCHQGSVSFAASTDKMKVIYSSRWQGSHSFGVSMIPVDYGFAAIQMGDATARGINLNLYGLFHGRILTGGAYGVNNGSFAVFNASGQYGSNENQLDGNTTYLHMGGIAKSSTTYAIAGKSERTFTSKVHYEDPDVTGIYDVFVRIMDQDLSASDELAGEDRNDNNGKPVDRNVVWLTKCDESTKAGAVKVLTLDDGAYCVLWEKFIDGEFDSVRYAVLDECGNILRPESIIRNARLSDNSTQPWTEGSILKWAVSDGSDNTLTFYTADLLGEEAEDITTTAVTTAASPATETTAVPTDTKTSATATKPVSTAQTATKNVSTDNKTTGTKGVLTETVTRPVSTSKPVSTAQTASETGATATEKTSATTVYVSTEETTAATEPATATEPAGPGKPDVMKGDVNTDGFIDSSDASLILEAYSNLSTGSASGLDEEQSAAADVNEDGIIDSTDASVILSYYAFISTGNAGTLEEFMAGTV